MGVAAAEGFELAFCPGVPGNGGDRGFAERLRAPVAALGTVAADTDPPIWTADATSIAHDLVRKDLMLDRRTASTTLLGVVVGVGLLEPLERWLARATGVGARAVAGGGMYDIGQIEHAAHLFREWDDTFGGGLRRKAVVGQLDEVNDLIDNTGSAAVRQRLLRVLSLLSETAATMSWDSGEQHTAQRCSSWRVTSPTAPEKLLRLSTAPLLLGGPTGGGRLHSTGSARRKRV